MKVRNAAGQKHMRIPTDVKSHVLPFTSLSEYPVHVHLKASVHKRAAGAFVNFKSRCGSFEAVVWRPGAGQEIGNIGKMLAWDQFKPCV